MRASLFISSTPAIINLKIPGYYEFLIISLLCHIVQNFHISQLSSSFFSYFLQFLPQSCRHRMTSCVKVFGELLMRYKEISMACEYFRHFLLKQNPRVMREVLKGRWLYWWRITELKFEHSLFMVNDLKEWHLLLCES